MNEKIIQVIPASPSWEAVFHPIDSPKGDFRTPVGAWALIETEEPPLQRVVGMVATFGSALKPVTEYDPSEVEFVRYEICVGVSFLGLSPTFRYSPAVRSR